jgi:hypothetical protein
MSIAILLAQSYQLMLERRILEVEKRRLEVATAVRKEEEEAMMRIHNNPLFECSRATSTISMASLRS